MGCHLLAAVTLVTGLGQSIAQTSAVNINSQLMITDLRVTEDPVRTNPRNGLRAPWTFKHLVTSMAGDKDPSEFVMRMLRSWETDQVINGSVAKARAAIRSKVIDPWIAASGGTRLNLDKAPFKLLAIVNRMDLRAHDENNVYTAGEGRFVFGVMKQDGTPLPTVEFAEFNPGGFVFIFEYELVATNRTQLGDWALRWSNLGRFPMGSAQYNAALEAVTRQFTDRNRAPHKPNGSAINQIRSNEFSLADEWELREFRMRDGWMAPHGVAQTPDIFAINGTPMLANLLNNNASAILNGTFVVPPNLEAASSIAGLFRLSDFPGVEARTFTALPIIGKFDIPWDAEGIQNNDVRQAFSLNTCSGCHRAETMINFLHVGFPTGHSLPRSLGKPARLSDFMTGGTVTDPVAPSTTRSFNDLNRRRVDLQNLIQSFGPSNGGAGPRTRHFPNFVH